MDWQKRKVLVTGGASFIGSNQVNALLDRGAHVRVVYDMSSGRLSNVHEHIETAMATHDLMFTNLLNFSIDLLSIYPSLYVWREVTI
jgi:nucleoside-diphosphate-sugar epimerase